ncbi:MAG: group 1 truncated hemoglobin [Tepidisphaeraceae bacterium]
MGKSWFVSGVMGLGAVLCMAATGCQSNAPKPLYDRLGGNIMISAIVEDFVGQAAADPRVNFLRKGTSAEWQATPENVEKLKVHLTEFLDAAAGGSEEYHGRDMRSVHAGMQITTAEFDAIEADLAKSLAKYDVPARETSEVMAIVEGTRKDIVEEK